ncbi:MAG: LytTR family DNA-binding domain-containing protein [Bacteroidetes bacterium]|nr:LytTR family DNA-binding domain-containing protein [Bacteroidota bacterium]
MNLLKVIIVDDEESACDVLENLLLRFCENVKVMGKYHSVLQAVEAINTDKPDIVFSDIEMPNYAGYEIVNFFKEINFDIVFITAYDQYAIRAFEVAAIDYLLKPIDIERLKKAIERVRTKQNNLLQVEQLNLLSNSLETKKLKNIVVSNKGQQNIISIDNIIAIEASESYCTLYTTEKKYLASKNLKHFETLLENNSQFIRIHKSWLINKNYLVHYSKTELNVLLKGNITAKLSKYKKTEFESFILS